VRILITGASGLLGINLALEAAQEHTVFGAANKAMLKTDAFSVLQADLLDPSACQRLLDAAQPDWVIHCAALANIDACEKDPEQARQLNSAVPAKLAELVARGGARMLHVSTDAVFDGEQGNYTEQDPPNPLSVYAATKLEGEQAVTSANPEALITRVNLFGWSMSGKRSLAEFFFYSLQSGNRINGFTDVYFCPLFANDLARIFLKMLSLQLSGLYHVVSSQCLTKFEFGQRLARKFNLDGALISPLSVYESELAAARSPRLTLNTNKLTEALGERPPGVDSGLDKFWKQYLRGYPGKIKGFRSR
jgi:dTDP-4-dehydrorhamnose reductase